MTTLENHVRLFDPNSDINPDIEPLVLMRPETGERITPARAQQERRIAEATTRRTVAVGEWGPGQRQYFDTTPDGLTYSA